MEPAEQAAALGARGLDAVLRGHVLAGHVAARLGLRAHRCECRQVAPSRVPGRAEARDEQRGRPAGRPAGWPCGLERRPARPAACRPRPAAAAPTRPPRRPPAGRPSKARPAARRRACGRAARVRSRPAPPPASRPRRGPSSLRGGSRPGGRPVTPGRGAPAGPATSPALPCPSASTKALQLGQRSGGRFASARATAGRSSGGSMVRSGGRPRWPAITSA